ncbi:hypothetical protein pb186bvf_014005 [Paramecium bursaria]
MVNIDSKPRLIQDQNIYMLYLQPLIFQDTDHSFNLINKKMY